MKELIAKFMSAPYESIRELKAAEQRLKLSEKTAFFHSLEDAATTPEHRQVLLFLRQAEWQWFECENCPTIRFIGLPVNRNGHVRIVIRGYYIVGKNETGDVESLTEDDVHGEYRPGLECSDPRLGYEMRRIKAKIYREAAGYYVALVGRVIDLLKSTKKPVRRTYGEGYLGEHPAFVLHEGPYASVEEARIARDLMQLQKVG